MNEVAYLRHVDYNTIVSMDQCHICMCQRTVAWTSNVTYVCDIELGDSTFKMKNKTVNTKKNLLWLSKDKTSWEVQDGEDV